jgi:hypothetical protein
MQCDNLLLFLFGFGAPAGKQGPLSSCENLALER